ncbi:MAG: Gfo/Idh/MocA family oxidoreductase [Planctomycetes bacterium]|nr:Gfo/Idh/MocA family oxidoreductase [Planctomycetota bacterium]
MAKYRSLLLGCGPRAKQHVAVYREIDNMEMVAVCDLQQDRREAFLKEFGVPKAYDDYEKALAAEKPDVVHVVTQPGRREWEMETAAKAGVKAAIVEKPMAIIPSDIEKLARIHRDTGIKIIVNCQRRYFPQFRDGTIRDIVENKIGKLYLVRASAKGNTMGMGPHLMDLLMLFLGEAKPEAAWAMAYGINEEGYQATHRAPEHILAEYWFPDDIRVIFDCDTDALGTPGEESFWMHLHFDFLGSEGRLYLTQNKGYWYQSHGMAEPVRGESSWDNQGFGGQRDFTKAVGEWLDGGEPHLNRFEVGKAVFDALIGAQASVYYGKKIDLPCDFSDEQWTELREQLKKNG